eukprot:jgi/Tetstr1/429306/TSEL_019224.t1
MDEKPVTAKRRRSARGTTAPARTTRKADTGPPKPLPPPVPAAAEQPGAKTRRPRKNKKEPMCKVQGCNESVANMKTLNLRYRICDFHAKAPVVMQDGEQLRFCQQCSRLHPVEDFDNNKRSCRFKLDLIGQRRKTRIASELQKMGHLRGAAGAGTSRAPSQALQAHHLGEDQPTSSGEPSAACAQPFDAGLPDRIHACAWGGRGSRIRPGALPAGMARSRPARPIHLSITWSPGCATSHPMSSRVSWRTARAASRGDAGSGDGDSQGDGERDGGSGSRSKEGSDSGQPDVAMPAKISLIKLALAIGSSLLLVAAGIFCLSKMSSAFNTLSATYMQLAEPSFYQVATYHAQQILVSSFGFKLLAIIVLAMPLIVAGGLLYALIKHAPIGRSLFLAYTVVNNCPGSDVVSESETLPLAILNVIFVVGMLTYAVFLGFVSDEVRTEIDLVRDSNAPVMESGHNVVLGWNRIGVPLLQQAAVSREELQNSTWSRPIVVLCEDGTPEFRDQLHAELEGAKLKVIVRQGNPSFIPDLLRAGTTRASTVIMLDTSLDSNDADQEVGDLNRMATASGLNLAVSQVPGHKVQPQTLVMQADHNVESSWLLALGQAEFERSHPGNKLVTCYNMERVGQLAAVCALHPGLGKVYTALLQQTRNTAEFYVASEPSLAGKTHFQIRHSFPNAVVAGYLSSESRTADALMNPRDDYVMRPTDDIVLIAGDGRDCALSTSGDAIPPGQQVLPVAAEPLSTTPVEVVIFSSWEALSMREIEELVEMAPPGSRVSVVAEKELPGLLELASNNVSIRFVQGRVTDRGVLAAAGVDTCDSVVLSQTRPSEIRDKTQEVDTLASLMAVSSFRRETAPLDAPADGCHGPDARRPLHVVGLASNIETVEAARIIAGRSGGALTVDILEPDKMVGGLLAQVAAEPKLCRVLRQLTVKAGCEIYVRRMARYFPGGVQTAPRTFGELEALARMRDETAIGRAPLGPCQ